MGRGDYSNRCNRKDTLKGVANQARVSVDTYVLAEAKLKERYQERSEPEQYKITKLPPHKYEEVDRSQEGKTNLYVSYRQPVPTKLCNRFICSVCKSLYSNQDNVIQEVRYCRICRGNTVAKCLTYEDWLNQDDRELGPKKVLKGG